MVKGDYKSKTKEQLKPKVKVVLVTREQLQKAKGQFLQTGKEKYGEAKRYFGKTKLKRLPRVYRQTKPEFAPQFQQPVNMFQKGNTPEPLSSSMDLLFGGEGERLVGNTQAVFPQLQSSDVGDIISSVQSEMFGQLQQQRIQRRRRR